MPQHALTHFFANIESGGPCKGAFPSRRAVMPFFGKRRLPADAIASEWSRLLSRETEPRGRTAYVHIPFCANHCLFCGFYRNAYVRSVGATYVERIIEEIEREASAPAVQSAPVTAVYLGGGTPSALTAEELARLLGTLRARLPLANDCEITVEGRIIHFDADKIDACLEAGANRFSIGVQSFDTDVRRRQGRRSSRGESVRFLEALQARDRAAVVIDLMYGLPDQSLEVWKRDLETATAIAPDGIDLYGLNLIPNSPLVTAMEAGKFPKTPDAVGLLAYYCMGSEFLGERSWQQISNNHWARTQRERNRYNLMLKQGADCLAYGSGAGGSFGPHSYVLCGDLALYDQRVDRGEKPIAMMVVGNFLQPLAHLVTGGLEVGRLDLALLERAADREVFDTIRPLLAQWQKAGLLSLTDKIVDLTVSGRFWYGNLISALHTVLERELLSDQTLA
jgi:anaerobilin synthase